MAERFESFVKSISYKTVHTTYNQYGAFESFVKSISYKTHIRNLTRQWRLRALLNQ